MDPTVMRLAQFVTDLSFEQIPEAALHEAKRRLIDSAACAAAAYPEALCAQLRRFAGRYQGRPAARIWGSGAPTSLEMAAFVNGSMLRYLDFSDTHLSRSAGHPSDMLGALVAVAEGHQRSGRALLEAVVVAYEVYCGLCDSVALQPHAVDQATCAALGSAAGVAKLLQLSTTQTANALSLALAPNVHLYNVRAGHLSDWKGCAGPNGARNGLFAALLAGDGITGPTAPFEGPGGFFAMVGVFAWREGQQPARMRIEDTHLKCHPVCYHGQSAIDAALQLRAQFALDQVRAIEISSYASAVRAMGSSPDRWAPTTRESADHSLPYTVACALRHGRLGSDLYAAQCLADADTAALMRKITVQEAPELTALYPAQASTRIRIVLHDARTLEHMQPQPKGHALNPLTDAELERKFTALFAPWGTGAAARRALNLLWRLETVADTRVAVDCLCPAP